MIKYLDEDYIIAESKNNNKPIQDNIELVHISDDFVCSEEQEKVLEDLAILNGYTRGKSFNFSPWRQFVKYSNDKVKQDFVSYKNALLACRKTHSSSTPPTLLYNAKGDIIGVDSEYWTFVFGLTGGGEGGVITKDEIIEILGYTPSNEDEVVKYTPQVLNDLEKSTARSNIGIIFDKDTDTLTLDGITYQLVKITNIEITNPIISLRYEHIPWNGGSVYPILDCYQNKILTYSDGTTKTIKLTNTDSVVYSGICDASGKVSRGVTSSFETYKVGTVNVVVTMNGLTANKTVDVYQEHVPIKEVSRTYDKPLIENFKYPNVDSDGGIVKPILSYKQKLTILYNNGDVTEEWLTSGSVSYSAPALSDGSVHVNASTITSDHIVATITVVVFANGKIATKDATITQNKFVEEFFVYFGSDVTVPETVDMTNKKQAPTTVEVKTVFANKHKCHWVSVLARSGFTITAADVDGDSIDLEHKIIGDYIIYYFTSPMNIDNTTKFTVR